MVYPVDFGVGAAGGDGRGTVLYLAGPPVQGPPPSDGEGYVPRAAPVDTLRNYLEEAESVQAGVWALLCVLSRWLNRYEAELPEGVMGGMGWRLRGPEGLRAK